MFVSFTRLGLEFNKIWIQFQPYFNSVHEGKFYTDVGLPKMSMQCRDTLSFVFIAFFLYNQKKGEIRERG